MSSNEFKKNLFKRDVLLIVDHNISVKAAFAFYNQFEIHFFFVRILSQRQKSVKICQ